MASKKTDIKKFNPTDSIRSVIPGHRKESQRNDCVIKACNDGGEGVVHQPVNFYEIMRTRRIFYNEEEGGNLPSNASPSLFSLKQRGIQSLDLNLYLNMIIYGVHFVKMEPISLMGRTQTSCRRMSCVANELSKFLFLCFFHATLPACDEIVRTPNSPCSII